MASRMTNVITVRQPYASLIMAGVKTWETRGNPPNGDMRPEGVRGLPGKRINAGDRILIHAANRPITFADCERFNTIDPLSDVQLGWVDGDPALYFRDDMVETSFEAGAWTSGNTFEISMTFGAILGSVRFEQVLPIASNDPKMPSEWDDDDVVFVDEATLVALVGMTETDISDQLPFGFWVPGGWAWQLSDPQPFAEPIPITLITDTEGPIIVPIPVRADVEFHVWRLKAMPVTPVTPVTPVENRESRE